MKYLLLALFLVSCGSSNDKVNVEPNSNVKVVKPVPIPIASPTPVPTLTEELEPTPAQIISAECAYYIEGYKAGCLSLANKGQSKEDKDFGKAECAKEIDCKL